MRNHEVTSIQPLLNEKGCIQEPGWARRPVWQYDRNRISSSKFRIKEREYYLVLNRDYACGFSLSDEGYIGLQSVSLLNFKEGWEHTETILNPFPMGKMKMPFSSGKGVILYKDKRLRMEFRKEQTRHYISCDFKDFWQGKPFYCELTLECPEMDILAIAVPWTKKAFYYNQKINCMRAEGYMAFDGITRWFDPEQDYGTLNWSRGVWTRDSTWYWSSGNGTVGGRPFGFNIGCGPGDTSAATENILFYEGISHKLDDVQFNIPEGGYMNSWFFTSSDGRFEMEFTPVLDRAESISALAVRSERHQVFGKMRGRAVLDDGRFIELKDFTCFAEKVYNRL